MRGRWLYLLGLGIAAGAAQAQETDIARRFGTLDGVTQVSLSPDGQRLAFLAQNKGLANDLFVVDIADGATPRRILRASGDPEILQWCKWATDARLICQIGGREKVGEFILFRAIVAIAPVTDLGRLKTESARYTSGAIIRDFIGSGPHIREGSPAQNADRIAAPVLMFHGTLDQHVDIDQARIMRGALASAGKKVELVEYPGLAHSLSDSETRAAMLAQITGFLPH